MLYALTTALGAFLLFLVQPMAAKVVVPWFGGSAAVWSTCLVFFQTALLLGYVYAGWCDRRLNHTSQRLVHLVVLVASVVMLVVASAVNWKPGSASHPAVGILLVLTGTLGLPYFVLSTTGPLLQAWYRERGAGTLPYRFYAWSNAASLLALLSYPVAIEPFLSRRSQAVMWLGGYAAYVVLMVRLLLADRRNGATSHEAVVARPGPSPRDLGWWVAQSGCASLLLAAVTSHLTQNIAPMPFLWVLPLGLYLISLIICFSHERAYVRLVWMPLAVLAACALTFLLFDVHLRPLGVSVAAFAGGLFACCMFCHGELARSKPPASHLTTFYVASALGGALGAAFVALVAPFVFNASYELPIGLVVCVLLAVTVVVGRVRNQEWHRAWLLLGVALIAVPAYAIHGAYKVAAGSRLMARNFYGSMRVVDATSLLEHPYRQLIHGTIVHGAQMLDDGRRCDPIAYYGRPSGLDEAFARPTRPDVQNVGAIGLGAGTVAAYGGPGDTFTFYEINPLVADIAKTEFSFMTECAAHVTVVMGDARRSLERARGEPFDMLIVDAFSGDSVPVHLLTKEAFDVYFRHVKADGVIAIHISNRYVNLAPVLREAARHFGKDLRFVHAPAASDIRFASDWGLMGAPGTLIGIGIGAAADPGADIPLWTDDFSSVWNVLKW